jgi:two-component system chemotaxis response regulator CheB
MSLSVSAVSVSPQAAIRVMIVDDALMVRGIVAQWLSAEPDFQVVGNYRNGREAIANLAKAAPDVVVLDIDMPELDGLATLPLLLAYRSDLVVIMASTLTRRNAEVSFRALALGAADYVPKPGNGREMMTAQEFRRELTEKIRNLGRVRRSQAQGSERVETRKPALRPFSRVPPRAILFGSSTGGPEALQVLVRSLAPVVAQVPVLIAQHMPATFTTVLAEHLGRASGRPAREASHGEAPVAGSIYVAPGGRHMCVEARDDKPVIVLDDGPPVNYCKPAVNPLFQSAATAFGPAALGVVLTGMGSDGAQGATALADAGGSVIAQDEATSVIWGMPGAAVQTGACAAVLPLHQIASKISQLVSGGCA